MESNPQNPLLVNPAYEIMYSMGHVVHDKDVRSYILQKEIIPTLFPTSLPQVAIIFSPSVDPAEHDKNGNVRFELSLEKIAAYYGSDFMCYYVETTVRDGQYKHRMYITDNEATAPANAILLNLSEKGYPLWRDADGQTYFAETTNDAITKVEICVEYNPEVASWLFKACRRIPVNHSEANLVAPSGKYDGNYCEPYNSSNVKCSTATIANVTRSRVSHLCPGFFERKVDYKKFQENLDKKSCCKHCLSDSEMTSDEASDNSDDDESRYAINSSASRMRKNCCSLM